MTKLEQKLIELGYVLTSTTYSSNKPYMNIYEKRLNRSCHIEVHYIFYNKQWSINFHFDTNSYICDFEMEHINTTYNEMQKDLEVLQDERS